MASEQIEVKRLFVTPEVATEWLSRNDANRALRRNSVVKMTDDMESGQWIETNPQPIIFDTTGALIDGQHRLTAVLKSGRSVWFWVATNIPRHTQLVIDDHIRRDVADFAKWEMPGHKISHQHVAAARAMLEGMSLGQGRHTRTRLYRFIRTHIAAVDFALGCFSKRVPQITTATTHAVIARAWYTRDRERLRRFAEVLETGLATDHNDAAAVTIYRFLLERRTRIRRGERYAKFERAVQAFLDGEPLTRVYATTKELFPLPEDTQQEPLLEAAQPNLMSVGSTHAVLS